MPAWLRAGAARRLFLALSGHARMVAGAAAGQQFLALSGHARIRAAGRLMRACPEVREGSGGGLRARVNAGMPGGA